MQQVDLDAAAATLRTGMRAEAPASTARHRKLVVAKQGPVSMILFAFEKGGQLKEHQADGEVIVQVLMGQLSVTVEGESVSLAAGQLLAFGPGQRHSVDAVEESDMLLCIARQVAPRAP